MRRGVSELRLQHARRLLDLVACLRGGKLLPARSDGPCAPQRAERLVGEGAQLRPVHDQLAAMGGKVEAVLIGERADQVDAVGFGHGAHAAVDLLEGGLLLPSVAEAT